MSDANSKTDRNPPADSESPSLGRIAGRGGLALTISSVASRGLSLLVQIVLGWLLTKEDFGLFAITVGIGSLAQVIRDGGITQILIQKGDAESKALSGPAFWLAFSCNLAAALLLVGATPFIRSEYGEIVTRLTWIFAASIPLSTPASVYRARLSVRMQLGRIAQMQLGNILIRSVSLIVLALLGAGPYSFVIPYLFTAVFENVFGYIYTREQPWRFGLGIETWGVLFRSTRWLMLSAMASGLNLYGAYIVLGRYKTEDLVGVFYFAYQLATQLTTVITWNLYSALFPVLSKVNADRERQRSALLRALRATMLACAPVSLALVAVIDPLETVIWHGRWAACVPCVIAFGWLFPFRGALMVTYAIVHAQGRFRFFAVVELMHAFGLLLVIRAASLLDSVTEIGWIVAVYYGVAGFGVAVALARRNGQRTTVFVSALAKSWLISSIIAAICITMDRWLMHRVGAEWRVAAITVLFSTFGWMSLRTILLDDLRDLLRVAPAKVGRLIALAMRLNSSDLEKRRGLGELVEE